MLSTARAMQPEGPGDEPFLFSEPQPQGNRGGYLEKNNPTPTAGAPQNT